MDICSICQRIPFLSLPFEDDSAYPHHESVPQLIAAAASCTLCSLILDAIKNLQERVAKENANPPGLPPNFFVSAGTARFTQYVDRLNDERYRIMQNCTKRLSGGRIEQEIIYGSKAEHRHVETLAIDGLEDRTFPFELYVSQQQKLGAKIRPWIYGNWWAFPHPKTPFMLIGFGVRLGRGPRISDALGNENGKIYFRGSNFRLFTEPTSNIGGLVPARRFDVDQRAGVIFERIQEFLNSCNKHHACVCPKPILPTRILDLGTTSELEKITLVETHGLSGQYIALSHSWGKSPTITTNPKTYQIHLQGIAISKLPKTFRDAVLIAKRLKVRYLWIDSLCIIQDSREDWERESILMGNVYSNSYVTIAASGSVNSGSGCFQPHLGSVQVPSDSRSTGFAEPRTTAVQLQLDIDFLGSTQLNVSKEWMPASLRKRPRAYEIGSFGTYFDPVGEQPLNSRAWTLQERYLSPRVLHYATDQIYFQCKEGIFAQDGSYFYNCYNISSVINRQTSILAPMKGRMLSNMLGSRSSGKIDSTTDRLRAGWLFVVEQYSRKNLSFESDKLPALSGLASEVARKTGDTYLAGIWRITILEGLLWRLYLREESPNSCDKSLSPRLAVNFGKKLSDFRYPSAYRAPSWSWASVDASICFETLSHENILAKYIDSHLEFSSRDIYGALKSGWLSIRGPLFELKRDPIGTFSQSRTGILLEHRGEIFIGTGLFDDIAHFPCFALFIDSENCLLLQKMNKKESEFRRIGLGVFVPESTEVSRSRGIDLAVPEGVQGVFVPQHQIDPKATTGLIRTDDACTTVIII